MKAAFLVGFVVSTMVPPNCWAEEVSDNSHCNLDYIRSVMQNSCKRLPRLRQLRRQLRHTDEDLHFFSDAIAVRRHRGLGGAQHSAAHSSRLPSIRQELEVPADVLLVESVARRRRRDRAAAEPFRSRSDPYYYFKFCCRNKTICEQLTCTR